MTSQAAILFQNPPTSPALPDAALGALDLWKRLRGDRLLPRRPDFTPVAWRAWLSDLSVIELHANGSSRHFVRLHGGRTQHLIGANLHQRYLEDGLSIESRAVALAPYIACERARQPTFSTMQAKLYPGVSYALSRLVLPFTDDTPEGGPDRVDRFVTWVGASSTPPFDMDTIYESMDAGDSEEDRTSLSILAD